MFFSVWILEVFKFLFLVVDGYLGLVLIFGVMVMFWFVGIYGFFIVELVVIVIYIVNVDVNLKLF